MKLRRTFGVLRAYIRKHYTRGEVKALLVESGCDPARMARLPVSGDMKAPGYKSMSAILSEGYDTISVDLPDEDADAVIQAMARRVLHRAGEVGEEEVPIVEALEADGVAVADLLGDAVPESAAVAGTAAGEAGMVEATRLASKAVARLLEGDRDGAVTVTVSALESGVTIALTALGLELPPKKTLPSLLVSLRRQSNMETLLGSTREAVAAVTALSTLVENLYLVGHREGDRHGGSEPPTLSRIAAALFVGSASTILAAIASSLQSCELRRKA